MSNQQKQTKHFFEKDANNWSKKSFFPKKNKPLNTIHERNIYVINLIKKKRLLYHLDVGCGVGDLVFNSSKITKKSVGIDFANEMIKIANKKYKKNNLSFKTQSIFDYSTELRFDCISANGFIEYLSINEIYNFFKISNKLLKKGGFFTISSRNRLFNLFSLNEFSKKEVEGNKFKILYGEALSCNKSKNLEDFKKNKSDTINNINFKQPNTGIKVNIRHQFTPLQLSSTLKKLGYMITDIHPINYHPVLPSIYDTEKDYKFFSNDIFKRSFKKNYNKLSNLPFSSSFMITAKK